MKKNKARNKKREGWGVIRDHREKRMAKKTKHRGNHALELHPAVQHREDLCKGPVAE